MGAYKNKQAVKSLLLIGVVLVVSVVTYISWISWYTHKYKKNEYFKVCLEKETAWIIL